MVKKEKQISTRVRWGHSESSWFLYQRLKLSSVTLAEERYFTLLFVVVVSFTRALLADLRHRTKRIFEKLTYWFIRINSLLLLKSDNNKKSCICLC